MTLSKVFSGVAVIFVLGFVGRIWLISDPMWGDTDPADLILLFLAGALVGFYPVYWGGLYRQALRNADKYGPFACVWLREREFFRDFECVLTDSDGEIVWIRRMSDTKARKFIEQFMYNYPDSGLIDLVAKPSRGWSQVFPALLYPREVVVDWKYLWTIFRVKRHYPNPNEYELENLSLIKKGAWWRWLFRLTLVWRPRTLSEACSLNVPGLTHESRDAYIDGFGLDTEPRGYEEALQDGRLVEANATY